MWTAEKRRIRDCEKRQERLFYKFIHEYMKSLHPDLYDQANNLHRSIRELYPNRVKDLTKTVEFMAATKPGETIPRYYYNRKTNNPHSGTSNGREMVLEIPLLSQSETALPLIAAQSPTAPVAAPCPTAPVAAPSPTAPVAAPCPTAPVAAPSPTAPVAAPCPTAPVAAPSPTAPVAAPCPTAPVSQPSLLEQHVYEALLKELQDDPDLNQILNDFPDDFLYDDDDMTELTPLERELQQLY